MTCLMCNRPLQTTLTLASLVSFQAHSQPVICQKCRQAFQAVNRGKSCRGCARVQENPDYCQDCLKWREQVPESLIKHEALCQYHQPLKDWLHAYKFQGDTRFAKVWREPLRDYYRKHRRSLFVPIPVSEKSYQERGFNQCAELLKCADIPYINLLQNIQKGQKQSEKNRQERMQTSQPFQLTANNFLVDQPILLFDDVYTTGRTLMHAKQLLHDAGVKEISSLSIGR